MGPQLYRCGNEVIWASTAYAATSGFNGAATLSLRKRSGGLSNALTATPWLQWGRNFIVAETAASGGSYTCTGGLQWGRNFIVAETRYATPTMSRVSALQWGRNFIVAETWLHDRGDVRGVFTLQWGRNFIVAETRRRRGNIPGHFQASMGPQLYRCGNIAPIPPNKSARSQQ